MFFLTCSYCFFSPCLSLLILFSWFLWEKTHGFSHPPGQDQLRKSRFHQRLPGHRAQHRRPALRRQRQLRARLGGHGHCDALRQQRGEVHVDGMQPPGWCWSTGWEVSIFMGGSPKYPKWLVYNGKSIYKWMIMVYKLRYTGNKRQIQWIIMVYTCVYIYTHIIVCDLHIRVWINGGMENPI